MPVQNVNHEAGLCILRRKTCLAGALAALLAVCLWWPGNVHGQGIGGSIEGVVKDETGAVLPLVLIRVINVDTGQARLAFTDGEGRYKVPELPPGIYDVTYTLGGFNTARISELRLSVAQIARLGDVVMTVAPPGEERIEVKESEVSMIDFTTATLSTSFTNRQIRELPILTRDLNNLALFAPGVFSVRTFSFASTLVPFAANGSRGRDNNFIIDSVDNNEPLFGGAAAQFTNTDIFAEYRILSNQFKAEYGRNSGSVVNIITERGGNRWRGSMFWFGQHDAFNAATRAERAAGLSGGTLFYENTAGLTIGGPLAKESTWIFGSYQWNRARADLTPIYPVVATLPTAAGLTALQNNFAASPTVAMLLASPTVTSVPLLSAPCGAPGSGLPETNPCTIGSVLVNGVPIEFGTFNVPRAGLFDIRDHQASLRFDRRLSERDDFYVRYLVDDLRTPRNTAGSPVGVAFFDFGIMPEWRDVFRQRTQSLGVFWTHARATALHELRWSFTRISSQTGAFDAADGLRELPAMTVEDGFATNPAPGGTPLATASLLAAFRAAGTRFTLGRDTPPSKANSNIFQLQDNVSISRGRHSIKFGGNWVRTKSDIRQTPIGSGQYLFIDFEDFVNNNPFIAFQRIGNHAGTGTDLLPLREFSQFYFFQDDIRITGNLTISLGLRYENYGQMLRTLGRRNPRVGTLPGTDRNNFAPRLAFAWSPDGKTIIRGGFGVFYNPVVFNIALLAWQSSPVSPVIIDFNDNISPIGFTGRFPAAPWTSADVVPFDINFTTEDSVDPTLRNPYVLNYSLSVQRQFGRDYMVEVAYVASKGTSLFSRRDLNPATGWSRACVEFVLSVPEFCRRDRINPGRGAIRHVTNGGFSTYHGLQFSGTKRLSARYGTAITAAYTWSHMIDNASEIFGPGVFRVTDVFSFGRESAVEAITPFAQDHTNTASGEKGNSSFDRRHRLAISYLWTLPSPAEGMARHLFGNWQFNGFFTYQSGQPFTPLNAIGRCADTNGDAILTNDRPNVGNPRAPRNSVALLNNTLCFNPTDPAAIANPIVPGAGPYITPEGQAIDPANARFVQAPLGTNGNAGRNILRGPSSTNFDMSLLKNMPFSETRHLQLRVEIYNLFNARNPGSLIGNVFATDAQPVPALAVAPVGPIASPARVTGVIPESAIDATDADTGEGIFLSQRFMNTSSRRFQFGLRFLW